MLIKVKNKTVSPNKGAEFTGKLEQPKAEQLAEMIGTKMIVLKEEYSDKLSGWIAKPLKIQILRTADYNKVAVDLSYNLGYFELENLADKSPFLTLTPAHRLFVVWDELNCRIAAVSLLDKEAREFIDGGA